MTAEDVIELARVEACMAGAAVRYAGVIPTPGVAFLTRDAGAAEIVSADEVGAAPVLLAIGLAIGFVVRSRSARSRAAGTISPERERELESLRRTMALAAEFYTRSLWEPAGQKGRDYLERRDLGRVRRPPGLGPRCGGPRRRRRR